ncbi:conserved hypothetical protein [Vibrio chagasii]|nr:conserved hypothetical protein [Vibrio chagasii]CAH7296890.1 conserved hypothetical protein [Vibrio chagasii]CAH7420898.1 conserved hypothetical protein [Vibrio chagasii]CAH7450089.1 conserved hypothetical protein [Vibrio chagasii]
MGILDFREICSGNPSHQSVKDAPSGTSNYPDDFELFCQEFFVQVKRFRIFRSVSNGPDLGIDLGVEELTPTGKKRWLVSCKHYAHSGGYISDSVERGITERVDSWDCDGFIPFYTGVPTSTLSQHILGVEKRLSVERYYKERIEKELLESSVGSELASRYFPRSMVNHYRRFIKPSTEYSKADIVIEGNVASLKGARVYLTDPTDLSNPKLDELVKDINIFAGFQQHKTYFNMAVEDAVSVYPEMFNLVNDKAEPTWSLESLVELEDKHSLGKVYFIAAVWSFWEFKRANKVFADFMIYRARPFNCIADFKAYQESKAYVEYHHSVLARGLLTPGCLGIKLQDFERDIVARLFAFANPI